MAAYWLARSLINDPVAYKLYTDQVPGIIAKHGGKVLARGGDFRILEGSDKYHRFIVVEFASLDDTDQKKVADLLHKCDMNSLLDIRLTREIGRENNMEVWL